MKFTAAISLGLLSVMTLAGCRRASVRSGTETVEAARRDGASVTRQPENQARKTGRTGPDGNQATRAATVSRTVVAGTVDVFEKSVLAAAPEAEQIAPDTPGAALAVVNGSTVAVAGVRSLPGKTGPALEVIISPPTAEAAAPQPAPVSFSRRPFAAGFTYEEQLFRTKWGWAAHEAVKRAALAEEQTTD